MIHSELDYYYRFLRDQWNYGDMIFMRHMRNFQSEGAILLTKNTVSINIFINNKIYYHFLRGEKACPYRFLATLTIYI